MIFSELKYVEFDILDRNEILSISKVIINNPINVVEFKKNHSLYDIRLGSFKNIKCGTCKKNNCDGHFGHIELVFPVINPLFLGNLKFILQNFCFKCYDTLKKCKCIDFEGKGKKRKLIKTSNIIKIIQNNYNRNTGVKIGFIKNGIPISLYDLYKEICLIKKEVYLKLKPNYSNFTNLSDSCFIHNLLVLPMNTRQPNKSNGIWRFDNITRLYNDIIKSNNYLRMKKNVVIKTLINEFHLQLQNSINILFDINNTTKKIPNFQISNGSLKQRIEGKQGRIRLNLMGKRVEFSARSVLSGDPNLNMNQIGIPPSVANNLTIPILVNKYNIKKILGKNNYNIKYITKNDSSSKFDLTNPYIKFTPSIEIGDTIERSLIDGDIVAINRQPTLHRGSIIACYVKIIKTSTFRLNYSSLISLNGDCDGDEINLHVPQDLKSIAELEQLMLSSTNIVSSQDSKPLVGLIQDALLGCYQLSKSIISKNDFMEILMNMEIYEFDLVKKNYNGFEIIDFLLLNLKIELDDLKIPKANFFLQNNKVVKGVLDKNVVGVSNNSLIHHIFLSFGHLVSQKFIFALQKAANAFLMIDGFSIGVNDLIVKHNKLNISGLEKYIKKKKDIDKEKPNEDHLLDALMTTTTINIPKNINCNNNNLVAMIKSGSKGSLMNFNQLTRCLGQQIDGYGRIKNDFTNRTFPHFNKNKISLISKGFIENSFIKGLNPIEFFNHSKCGRNGIIDTACKTSINGFIFRKLIKSLEKLVINESTDSNRQVIDITTKKIVSFCYGIDSLDNTYMKTIS